METIEATTDKGIRAARKFLARRGEVLEVLSDGEDRTVAVYRDADEGVLCFAAVHARRGDEFPPAKSEDRDRAMLEAVAMNWLADSDAPTCDVRLDVLSVMLLGGTRAFVRLHTAI
ncbi:MAG: hypothetical protein Q4F23_00095 [Coriobacteriia bacterium]|nr:hypothetical protein [Coriobacteriia bacterium]